ncbi:MAG TPA: hypothetical protein VNT42_11700, partial [Sphingomonas sp.]|nr:hypothetical protein [Sphingomonas sp.]
MRHYIALKYNKVWIAELAQSWRKDPGTSPRRRRNPVSRAPDHRTAVSRSQGNEAAEGIGGAFPIVGIGIRR